MARTLSTDLLNRVNSDQTTIVFLVDITVDGTTYHFTNHGQDLVSNGTTYTAFPLQIDPISSDKTGIISEINLTLSNLTEQGTTWFNSTEIRGSEVYIYIIDLSLPDEQILIFSGMVDRVGLSRDTFVATVREYNDYIGEQLPRRTHSRRCMWVFKGAECQYAGTDTTCGKTWEDCVAKNNTENFGGFPQWR